MAEKIKINLSDGHKKSSDEQFLKAPRNWQKCSALVTETLKYQKMSGSIKTLFTITKMDGYK
jgi:hypothetical protein